VAFRREKIKQQYDEALPAFLEPGEQLQAQTFSLSGPSPWLIGIFGWLFMLLLGQRYYFIVVTDRRVLFMKGSLWTGRPKGLAWADPRSAIQIHDVDVNNTVWSKFRYRRPDGKDMRINIHRIWREDGQAVVAALSGQPAQQPQQPPAAAQPPAPGQFQA
jgi:hypothetical protein